MKSQKRVLIIDGMGGGIGKTLAERIFTDIKDLYIIAAGTNPFALNNMLNAGANEGSDNEQKIIEYTQNVDIIIGAMGILIPNGLNGEMTKDIVLSICQSDAIKILIPMDKCGIRVATDKMPINHYINHALEQIKNLTQK